MSKFYLYTQKKDSYLKKVEDYQFRKVFLYDIGISITKIFANIITIYTT